MVGPIDKQEEIRRALKVFILKEREKERRDEEVEAEKTRKKKEQDEKKHKDEEEYKFIKTKLNELTKKRDKLQQDKNKILDHLKKVREDTKHPIQIEDLTKLYSMGVAITHVSNASSSPVHPVTAPVTIIPRVSAVSVVNSQYKTTTTTSVPVQPVPAQKRNRSPSPTMFHRAPHGYKVAAGPHPFQKLEDTHRNHEYNRSYLYQQGSAPPPPSSNYSAFYPPAQSVVYTHPSPVVHNNAAVYSSYGANRDSVEVLHKSQPHPPTPPQHSSLYLAANRSSLSCSSPSIQTSNHVSYLVDHAKSGPSYPDDKYYMIRPGAQVPVHGSVIPIQPPPPQTSKHGSITSGFPVRPPSTQIGGPPPMHIQSSHSAGHLGSQSSHHPSHHSPHGHHSASQQSPVAHHQGPPSHHQQSTVHYPPPPPPHTQSQLHHSSQPPPSSVSLASHHHQPPPPHIQQLHVQSHHPPPPPSSHHQILSHHSSPSIHHSSSQQHLQQAIHHQQALQQSQSHHAVPHSQSLHHQPHIQQHISSQGQQSQPTSVVTSQAYVNQLNAMQGGSRVVYSHGHPLPH